MRTCTSCGFDGAPDGAPCTLCGTSSFDRSVPAGKRVSFDEPTLPFSEAATQVGGAGSPAAGERSGARSTYPDGTTFAGRYRSLRFVGRGGMGCVYRCTDLREGRDVALKVLNAEAFEEEGGAERFRREVELLSRIRHPAVPRVHGWGTEGRDLFYVSEFIDGRDLKSDLRERGPWRPLDAAALAATVADALAAAHEAGIVHRDVKPHNIMIATDGSVRLVDFGIARSVGLAERTITGTGITLGTPEYMSPEQVESHRVDARSDLYSLGVVLFEILTGSVPFSGATPVSVALKHRSEQPPPVRSLRPDVPAWLDRIVQTCLEKDREKRFQSAADLAEALRRPRLAGHLRRRRLATGDVVVEDDAGETEWALLLETAEEKTGWTPGMALAFGGHHYRLAELVPSMASGEPWLYRFEFWPEDQVFRLVVDYALDASERARAREGGVLSRLRKLIPG